nr:U3 small nucleolar ribonucleoprotein protein MPP10 [Tanacetum cinerariifolium]
MMARKNHDSQANNCHGPVSDAAMLAPEEVFAGKGDFKEEAELTQADRKRRRASKKRKFKDYVFIIQMGVLEISA